MPVIQTPAECRIQIDGKEIKYDISSVQLDQFVDDHHILKIRIRQLGKATSDKDFDDPDKYTGFLGKSIAMNITPHGGIVDSSRLLEFIGIVTEVSLDNSIDGINTVLVTAHSPTLLLDGPKQNALYHELSASDIIESVVRNYPITVSGVATTPGTLKFSIQYRETDYQYVMRLATTNGLFACYDGKEYKVDKAGSAASQELVWRESLGVFSIGLGSSVEKFGSQVFDYSKKETYEGETSGALRTSLSDLSKVSHDASKKMFPNVSFTPLLQVDSQAILDNTLEAVRGSSVGKMITCQGESIIPAVAVGHCVKIKGMDKLDGQYWVKSVKHFFDESGKYYNAFACTPLDLAFPERKFLGTPFTDLQPALVTDTDDPDKLGRVKVRFVWNVKEGSPAEPGIWVRLLTLHAGENKGWYCIPEIDDEVMVGFEHGDPSRPVILGCLYNGKDVPPVDHPVGWDGKKNNLKLFRTKSGNEIYFSDDSGSEAIVIVQKDNKNTITLSLDGPKIAIESEGDISLKAANISLESTSGDITLKSAAGLKAESTQDTEIKASGSMKTEGSMNYNVKAGMNATVEGGAVVTVKGTLVKIN
jgi:type VI secretion system secreted protein VgrG